jgi:hypothetical protein
LLAPPVVACGNNSFQLLTRGLVIFILNSVKRIAVAWMTGVRFKAGATVFLFFADVLRPDTTERVCNFKKR